MYESCDSLDNFRINGSQHVEEGAVVDFTEEEEEESYFVWRLSTFFFFSIALTVLSLGLEAGDLQLGEI